MNRILQWLRTLLRNLFADATPYEEAHGPSRRRRVLNTILLLLFFRVLADIPALNVDEERLQHLLADNPFLGFVDLLAGGDVLTHFSVVAAGIFPYLVALVVAQGATLVVPSLRALRSRSEELKQRVKLIARILTVVLAFLFALAISHFLARQTGLFPGNIRWFTAATFFPTLWIVCLVTFGSVLSAGIVNWITRAGIGPGENVVLLAGASLALAKQIGDVGREAPDLAHAVQLVAVALVVVAAFAMLSFPLLSAARRVPFALAKRPGHTFPVSFLLNSGGIVPVSGAIGLLSLLRFGHAYLGSHFGGALGAIGNAVGARLSPESGWFWAALAGLIVLFTYVCNLASIGPGLGEDAASWAENMRKGGVLIPGKRPGGATEEFLARTVSRLSLPGGLSMAFLAAGLPYLIFRLTQRDVTLTVLSIIVIVKAVEVLRRKYEAEGTMEKYDSFLPPRRGSS